MDRYRRLTLADWLWRGLTALVFGAVMALTALPVHAADLAGRWRVTLDHPGGPLPFNLEVRRSGRSVEAWLLNPPERMKAEQVSLNGETLVLAFPSYGSRLTLTRSGDDRLSGRADLLRSTGPVSLSAAGSRAAWRFSAAPARPLADLSGRWTMRYGADKRPGVLQLKQSGNAVSGSVQLASGDYRYLAGEVSGDRLSLSTFDGNATSLWTASLRQGVLDGSFFAATSKAPTPWSARKAAEPAMAAVATEKPATDRLTFRFPTSDGRMVSLADAAYRGKVVVLTLGGAWCPNCHDEALFLGPYSAKRRKEGLEVIGLQFEYGDDKVRAFRQIDSFARRYKLPYPLLLAGQPTPESTRAALGALGPVKVYPTAIFIGRDGRVREVHVGWAGPATGKLNAEAKRHFDATVTRLLREKA